MSKISDIPSPNNWRPKTTYFDVSGRLRNVTSTLTMNIFGTKRNIQNGKWQWKLQGTC